VRKGMWILKICTYTMPHTTSRKWNASKAHGTRTRARKCCADEVADNAVRVKINKKAINCLKNC